MKKISTAVAVASLLFLIAACESDPASNHERDPFSADVVVDVADRSDAGSDAGDVAQDTEADVADADAVPPDAADVEADTGPDVADRTDQLYDPTIMRRVSLTIPQRDWDELRRQARTFADIVAGPDCLTAPFPSPFTWFEASVVIDGVAFDRIDVRKKGFLGSLDEERPGLKLDLGEFVDDQNYLDARHLTLNNAKQDPAVVRQCLGYWFAERAGLPSPRCSFATLEVNGESLGVYVNVEPLKRAFIERWYGDYDGNFYEGTLSDFSDRLIGTFEAKNGDESRVERPDIEAVRDALQVPDDELIAALEQVVDLDQFMTFWAVEVLLMHIDGYAANRNNFYLYLDPDTGLFQFIPWGIDGILGSFPIQAPPTTSVYAGAALTARLYAHPEGRRRYFERLQELLDGPWDETAMLREMERMATLVLLHEPNAGRRGAIAASVQNMRSVIGERRALIEAELAAGEPVAEPAGIFECFVERGTASATFDTQWGSIAQDTDTWFSAEQEFEVEFAGDDWTFVSVGAAVGVEDDGARTLVVVGVFGEDTLGVLSVGLGDVVLQPGEFELDGALLFRGEETGGEFVQVGWADVLLRLDDASELTGAPFRGSLEASVLGFDDNE